MAPKRRSTGAAKKAAAKGPANSKAEATAEPEEVQTEDFAMETGRDALKDALDCLKKKKLFPAKAEKVGSHPVLPNGWQGSSLKEASTFSVCIGDLDLECLEVPSTVELAESAEFWFGAGRTVEQIFVSATVVAETKQGQIAVSPEDSTKISSLVFAFGKAATSMDHDLTERYRRLSTRVVVSMTRGHAQDAATMLLDVIQGAEDVGRKAVECSNAMPFTLASRLSRTVALPLAGVVGSRTHARIRAALAAQQKASTHEEVFLLLKNIRWNGEAYKVKTPDQIQKLTAMLEKTNAAGMSEAMKACQYVKNTTTWIGKWSIVVRVQLVL
ncbi:unnamed protein product [Symbiodinium sp. CCMP2456]|nr:unnamed protein product [Symbiodinium sp. CCMP2456]